MTPPDNGKTPASADEPGARRAPESGARTRRTAFRRGTLVALAVVAGGAVALTACGGHSGGASAAAGQDSARNAAAADSPSSTSRTSTPSTSSTPSGTPSTTHSTAASTASPATQKREDALAAKHTSAAKITITPKTGTTQADISGATKVTATGGTLTSVKMTATSSGRTVAGTMSADKKSWRPNASLAHGVQYRISATAKDADGTTTSAHATFATKASTGKFVGYYTPGNGSVVGVGMPVSINFSKAISTADRTAVQRGITVTSSSGQKVVGHWFSSTRLDFRPQTYWKAGSHITLGLNLAGVEGAPGYYGVQHKTVTFDIGRSQVSTVDAATHMMTVVRDGKVIRTLPISAGGDGHTTYDGQMVIEEKDESTRMDGSTVGFTDDDGKSEYDIPDVPHAMRLSNSGTFIHGNYWSDKSVFGTANTSHGCIGLSDVKGGGDDTTDAAWFYNNSLIGDVVVVKNSPDKTIQPDNGLNGWNMSWKQWVAGSAL